MLQPPTGPTLLSISSEPGFSVSVCLTAALSHERDPDRTGRTRRGGPSEPGTLARGPLVTGLPGQPLPSRTLGHSLSASGSEFGGPRWFQQRLELSSARNDLRLSSKTSLPTRGISSWLALGRAHRMIDRPRAGLPEQPTVATCKQRAPAVAAGAGRRGAAGKSGRRRGVIKTVARSAWGRAAGGCSSGSGALGLARARAPAVAV